MGVVSELAAMVETLMRSFLTLAGVRSTTWVAGPGWAPGLSWVLPMPQQFETILPPLWERQSQRRMGDIANPGRRIGASAPAVTGDIDAT
jgi:hypothetical protein